MACAQMLGSDMGIVMELGAMFMLASAERDTQKSEIYNSLVLQKGSRINLDGLKDCSALHLRCQIFGFLS